MPNTSRIVDLDNPGTWPTVLAGRVRELTEEARGTTDCTGDLAVEQYEDEVCGLLDGYLVRAFHCTRLLEHEAANIQAHGLRTLSPALVQTRLTEARDYGYLTEADHTKLSETHHFTTQASCKANDPRRDQICLALPAGVFDSEAHSFHLLLSCWGGEAIYWAHADDDEGLGGKLRTLGRPTIIVTLLDFSGLAQHDTGPTLANLFVGAALGLADVHGGVDYFNSIPADRIDRLLHPGDADYDRHLELPQH
ncbi:hypothetical protein [Crossiella sp. CA198]|uniref:hypothetical protein n=1 Tax=Crossiella sp. CA198 TaxID=3455607 RepID=UPI003F8D0521